MLAVAATLRGMGVEPVKVEGRDARAVFARQFLRGETDGIRELVQQNTRQVTEILSRFAAGIQQQLSQIELTRGPQGVRGPRGAEGATGPAGSNTTLPTDVRSVAWCLLISLVPAMSITGAASPSGLIGGSGYLGPVLRFVIFKHDIRVALGGQIDAGEWRCLNSGMETYINSGHWIGLFVRVA